MTKNTRPRSQHFREMLAAEYLNSTISIKELSEKYHTDAAYQLTKHGVQLKGKGTQKMLTRTGCIEYKWDASTVETEEQAYSLGFLTADGYNTGLQVGLKVKASDLDILKKIKNCFSESIQIQTEKNSKSFVISSMVICENLRKLGIIKNKSHNEKAIPVLKPELVRHFIRGYFDGDGTVFICKARKNRFLKCNICSSTSMILYQIQDILSQNSIQCTVNKEDRKGKIYNICGKYRSEAAMDMYRLFIRRKSSIEKLFHYLYDGATIYLERKYSIFSNNQDLFVYRHVNTELIGQITKGCSTV